MTDDEIALELKQTIANQLDYSRSMTDEQLLALIEDAVFAYSRQSYLPAARKEAIVRTIFHGFRGLDVLQPLMDDPSITEIMVNNHEEIFYERDGQIYRYHRKFESSEKLEDIIQAIVAKVNRVVNESQPIVDARLKDGSRVNVVLPPVAVKGPTLTIRKFPAAPMTLDDLVERQALTREAAEWLRQVVRAKYNLFISGGTGSGKTTLLGALAAHIPPDERIITIEDSAELQIRTVPNLVSLETRNANTEGKGEIPMRDLIKASLRMRPNRIIVGEVRGPEAFDMLQAMNTGHDGSLSTGHANSTRDMLSRLETMVLSAAPLPIDVIRQQIASAIDIMIHVSRLRDKSRKVMAISELVGLRNGEYVLNPVFEFRAHADEEGGVRVQGELVRTGRLKDTGKLEAAGLKERE